MSLVSQLMREVSPLRTMAGDAMMLPLPGGAAVQLLPAHPKTHRRTRVPSPHCASCCHKSLPLQ
jgi:hypothetical protein